MPIVPTRHQVSERTFGLLRVQAWDGSAWEDVDAVGNPIEDWIVPTVADGPGDEVRTLAFLPVTTRTRVVFEEANV